MIRPGTPYVGDRSDLLGNVSPSDLVNPPKEVVALHPPLVFAIGISTLCG
jgi:hypothetical protein